MAPIQNLSPFSLLLLLFISLLFATKQPLIYAKENRNSVKALVAPITKGNPSLYTISLKINNTNNQNQQFIVDLSSTFLSFPCCPYSNPNGVQTSVIINSTDGKNPTGDVTVPGFKASCNATSLAGLAKSPESLSSQLIAMLSLKKQFGICLPDSNRQGVIFFGSEPYYSMWPYSVDLSTVISYTPLVKHPKSPSYMITLTGFAVNHTQILSFKPGTTALLSTTYPYTMLRSDIYRPFIDAFNKEAAGYPRVASVKPFEVCLNKSSIPFSRVGYYVPQIDLMLDGGKTWNIFGSNSMVQASEEALCLGFIDGGMSMEHGMVIGGFQMENNFLLFDVDKSRLGFSSTLLFMRVTCGSFNFTSNN